MLRAGIGALATALGLSLSSTNKGATARRSQAKRHRQTTHTVQVGRSERTQVQAGGKKKKKKKKKKHCKGGKIRCGKTCLDSTNDPANCGGCGSRCYGGLICQDRRCVMPGQGQCEFSYTECPDGCKDLKVDIDNCGACGTSCRIPNAAVTCESGDCRTLGCIEGYDTCNAQAESICETHVWSDPDNCGTCGNVCSGHESCVSGRCCISPSANLQAAIDEAGSGNTLVLCSGTYHLASNLRVSDISNVVLSGVGADQTTLDGGNSVGVIKNEGTTKLQGMTITNGRADRGGGIYNTGHLELENVIVRGNTAERYGGGIWTDDEVQMFNSSVTGNTAGDGGGGIAIFTNSGFAGLTNSHVTNNTATGAGGGVYVYEGSTVFVSDGSTVADNTASVASGGGIFNENGTVKILGGRPSSVSGNAAREGNGGGIYTTGLLATVTLGNGAGVRDNTAGADGGGIETYGSKVTLEAGSRVTGNTAGGIGGGLKREEGMAFSIITIADATIVTNNFLADATPSNCAPVNTIANCIG
jgi:hypothetical protein